MSQNDPKRSVKAIWKDVESGLQEVSDLPVEAIVNLKEKMLTYVDQILQEKRTSCRVSSKAGNRKTQRVEDSNTMGPSEACHSMKSNDALYHCSCSQSPLFPAVDKCRHENIMKLDQLLQRIRAFLRRKVPFGSLPEPTTPLGKQDELKCSDMPGNGIPCVAAKPVFAVDGFLFLEKDIDELVEEGKINREYCRCCGSSDIGLTEFITHSFSQDQLVYLICFLFPHLIHLEVQRSANTAQTNSVAPPVRTVLDVGSRLGVVLWATYFAALCGLLPPGIEEVVGIELDTDFFHLQQEIGRRFCSRQVLVPTLSSSSLPNERNQKKPRKENEPLKYLGCRVVGGSCFEGAGEAEMRMADIIILHNVFEYFTEGPAGHLQAWNRLKSIVNRPGQLLVCFPSLEETLKGLEAKGAFDVQNVDHRMQKSEKKKGKKNKATTKEAISKAIQWVSNYVEHIDVSEVALQFFQYRQEIREQEQCGSELVNNEGRQHSQTVGYHVTNGTLNDRQNNSCSEEDEEEVPELLELVENIHVYRVK